MATRPRLVQTVLDTLDPRALAEFSRELLGYSYRPGDGPPTDGTTDRPDWLVITHGAHQLAFQQVDELPRPTWPESQEVPQLVHQDMTVTDREEL